MEVIALKGSSGDVQHFADRIFAERGVRYGRVAMIPTSAKTKRRPRGIPDDRDAGGRMSVPGQEQTFRSPGVMSVLPSEAEIVRLTGVSEKCQQATSGRSMS